MIGDPEKLRVKAVAPATSANLGAGFDVLGVALERPLDSVEVEVTDKPEVEITVEGIGSEGIPTEPSRNTAGIVAEKLLEISGRRCGLRLKIRKEVKPGRGLGSSAASAAATAVAVNRALDLNLPKLELIRFAARGEVAAAGFPHADNVSPAILGFFTVISSYKPLKVISLPPPENVGFVIATPEFSFDTRLARSILPKTVELHKVVYNTGRVATFIAGLTMNNLRLMGMGMSDSIVEPARERLIPGLSDVKEAAVEAGALGVAISGAGPSVLALVDLTEGNAERVAVAMDKAFSRSGVESQTICTKPGPGARIVKVWRV